MEKDIYSNVKLTTAAHVLFKSVHTSQQFSKAFVYSSFHRHLWSTFQWGSPGFRWHNQLTVSPLKRNSLRALRTCVYERIDKQTKYLKVNHPWVLELLLKRSWNKVLYMLIIHQFQWNLIFLSGQKNDVKQNEKWMKASWIQIVGENEVDWGQTTKSIYYLKACHLRYHLISFK